MSCKLGSFFKGDSTTKEMEDWEYGGGFRRVLLREGPAGIVGSRGKMSTSAFSVSFLCSLQVDIASSSFLREDRNSGVAAERSLKVRGRWTFNGRGIIWSAVGRRLWGTYGRLFGSSTEVKRRT